MTLRALMYVSACRRRRRARLWPMLGLCAAVALTAAAQALALSQADPQGALDPDVLDPLLRLAPLLLPAVLWMSTFSTPLRVRVAEVSWVMTAPGGTRALLTRALLLRPLGYAAVGLLGAAIARAASGRSLHEVWKVALVGAVLGLAVRLALFGGHQLVVHARAAVVLRAIAIAWASALVIAAVHEFPGGEWFGLRPVLDHMVGLALRPAGDSAAWLLVALGALLAATSALVAAARGLEEQALIQARRMLGVQESLRDPRTRQELMGVSVRRKVPSLADWEGASSERAFGFRVRVQLRREMLPSLVAFGLLLDIGAPLLLLDLAPEFAWAWAIVVVIGTVWSAGAQLAVELEHHYLRLAPLRPLRTLAWLGALPALHRIVSLELAWFPVLFAPHFTTGGWAVGAALIPPLVMLIEAAGSLAVARAGGMLARAALKPGVATVGAVPAAAAVLAASALDWPAGLAAPIAAAALFPGIAICLTRTTRHIWPKEAS